MWGIMENKFLFFAKILLQKYTTCIYLEVHQLGLKPLPRKAAPVPNKFAQDSRTFPII